MGCAQSRIDNEETVSRCRERKILIKEALIARTSFAVGHSSYAIAIKNAGSALSDYGHGESIPDPETITLRATVSAATPEIAAPPPPPPPPQEPLPPPPPPLPSFSPSPLQRSVTMPAFPVLNRGVSRMGELGEEEEHKEGNDGGGNDVEGKMGIKGMPWDYFFMQSDHLGGGSGLDEIDEEDEEEEEEEEEEEVAGVNEEIEFKTPEKAAAGVVEEAVQTPPPPPPEAAARQFVHANTAPPEVGRGSKVEVENVGGSGRGSKVNLMKVLEEIDEYFLKASECAQEVTKLLEAHKFHHHSNFADNRVPIDHAARVMRVITWNRPQGDNQGSKDDYEDNETLATVLDKIMAWEKKLYEEVKAAELMKMEYQRKVALLNRQKKRGASAETLEKTKAAVGHLQTRYIVDIQSMDSTVSEVNELRDRQLYPKLVELIDGMAKMWENIYMHHESQLNIAQELKALNVSLAAAHETSKNHRQCTIQLSTVVEQWQEHFENLVNHQKQFVRSLHNWLKLNLIPVETNLKEKISSPPRPRNPPIQSLLHAWHDLLQKFPDEVTKTAITSFGAVIKNIILHQEEEMKLRESCEELRREYIKKNQAFEEWYHKHVQRKGPQFMDPDDGSGKDPISEKRVVVESLKKRLDEELERHQRHCVQVREKSLGTLKTRLPELFRTLSEYAHTCSDAYDKLRAIVLSHSSNGGDA